MAKEGTFQLLGQPNPDVADINKGRIFWNTITDTFQQIDENGVIKDLTSENPAGNDTNVQFNQFGALGGSDNFVFDGTAVGIGTLTPDASALLDMQSTLRGFLMPVMTTIQRDAIPSPATGLEIYNITTNEPEFFNGSIWLNTGGTAAGGSNTQVQFNNNGAFGGISGITTDGTNLAVQDSAKISFGNSEDLKIEHTGSDSLIQNITGDLIIINQGAALGDIVIENFSGTNDIVNRLGSDNVNTRFIVKNSLNAEVFSIDGDGDVKIDDGPLTINGQLSLNHTAGSTRITSTTGIFTIDQAADAPLIIENLSTSNDIFMRLGNFGNTTNFKIQDGGIDDIFVVQGDAKTSIGTNSSPDASALLTLDSTLIGFLMPRMTTTQRDAIPSPATGLEIYNTTTNEPEFFDGSAWITTGGTAPGGSNTQVQFNNSGAFAGISGVTTDGAQLDFANGARARFGSGQDLTIEHLGDSTIINNTGELQFIQTVETSDVLLRLGGEVGSTALKIQDAGLTEIVRIVDSGNVGLGINPISRLHVFENNVSTDATNGITIEQDGTGDAALQFLLTGGQRWSMGIDNSNSDFFKISESDNLGTNTRVLIRPGGNVVIGDATFPESKLHVANGSAGSVSANTNTVITVESPSDSWISIFAPDNRNTAVVFGGPASNAGGAIFYNEDQSASAGFMFRTNDVDDRLVITSDGAVGIATNSPDASAILDLTSTTRGFKMPVMTTIQRDAIPSPATGLEIYNLTTNEPEFFNGSIWQNTGATAPGGADTQIQFNDNGTFNGNADFIFDGSNFIFDNVSLKITDASGIHIGPIADPDLIISHGGLDGTIVNETGSFVFENQSTTDDVIFEVGSLTNNTNIRFKDSASTDLLVINGDGNIDFIGTNRARFGPNQELTIQHTGANAIIRTDIGDLELFVGTGGDDLALINESTTNDILAILGTDTNTTAFRFQDFDFDDLMVVSGDGNVGINTSTPDAKLQIVEGIADVSIFTEETIVGDWTAQAPPDNDWQEIAFGNGLFVAVGITAGVGNKIITSPDGVTWTAQTAPADESWRDVTFDLTNNLFIASATSGTNNIMTSADGITWTLRTIPVVGTWAGVHSNDTGVIVAVSQTTNDIIRSTDGITWIAQTGAASNGWLSLTFGAGLFVAVGPDGGTTKVQTSPDGITWTLRTTPLDNEWSGVTFGNGLFVAVSRTGGSTSRVMTSLDGITWTAQISAPGADWQDVAFFDGQFVAIGASGDANKRSMVSPDGINWTIEATPNDTVWTGIIGGIITGNNKFVAVAGFGPNRAMTLPILDSAILKLKEREPSALGDWSLQTSAADNNWQDITFGNGTFVAISDTGTDRVITSIDNGITWINVSTPLDAAALSGITFGNDTFVVCANGNQFMTSTDNGATWTIRSIPTSNSWTAVTFGNNTFVAVIAAGGAPISVHSLDNGVTWSSAGSDLENLLWQDITFGNGIFVAVNRDGGSEYSTSPDGITWTQRNSPDTRSWQSLAFGNGTFVTVSASGDINRVQISIDNGVTWTVQAAASLNNWRSVTFGNGNFIAVANTGTGDRAMTSPDGITWTTETTPIDNSWQGVAFGNNTFVAVSETGTGDRAMTMPLIGTSTAILDMQSTTSGFLPPRMTELNRDNIPSPVAGLIIYNNESNKIDNFNGVDYLAVSNVNSGTTEIANSAELEALATGGIITIDSNRTYMINGNLSSDVELVFENRATLHVVTGNSNQSSWVYTGTGNFLSGTGGFRSLEFMDFIGTSSGTFANLNLSGRSLNMTIIGLFGWGDLGTVTGGLVFLQRSEISDNALGFKLIDCRLTITSGQVNNTPSSALPFIDIDNSLVTGREITVTNVTGNFSVGASLFRFDPSLDPTGLVTITGVAFEGNLFDTTGGSTGIFTAVADAAVPAEAITSVTDSSGVARFNFTAPPTLFVNQEVVISTFVTNTAYNGTFIITATGANFFEVSSIAFGSDETGSFLSNSVTLTDTATTLNDGDTLVIDTDDAIDYDGGATVYNQLTNSFQINRTFTQNETGTWDTSGIDQKDPRILATRNPGFPDSNSIAYGSVNAQGSLTTISDGAYLAIDTTNFTDNNVTERFKLTEPNFGQYTFTGNEDFSGTLTANISTIKTTSIENYRFSVSINEVLPVFATAIYAPLEVKTTKVQTTLTLPVQLTKGDTVQIVAAGDGTSDDMTVTDLLLSIN